MTAPSPLLRVQNLKKYFDVPGRGKLHAVDDLTFHIGSGETVGLVGESGCGKSTTGRVVLRLIPPTSGTVMFDGTDVTRLPAEPMRLLRRQMQMIFQDPYSCLDPRKTVAQIIAEPLIVQKVVRRRQIREKVLELMGVTGLGEELYDKFPHELDGGRRQRVGITRALALSPRFIVCDEPVSSLDVSIQAQILNLMQDLQDRLSLTYLFISHDLSVVRHIANRVLVMYLGQIVEEAESKELFRSPQHPYTIALLSAIPSPRHIGPRQRIVLRGDVPSPVNPPPGCRFEGRCPHAMKVCKTLDPPLIEVAPGHTAACHLMTQPGLFTKST